MGRNRESASHRSPGFGRWLAKHWQLAQLATFFPQTLQIRGGIQQLIGKVQACRGGWLTIQPEQSLKKHGDAEPGQRRSACRVNDGMTGVQRLTLHILASHFDKDLGRHGPSFASGRAHPDGHIELNIGRTRRSRQANDVDGREASGRHLCTIDRTETDLGILPFSPDVHTIAARQRGGEHLVQVFEICRNGRASPILLIDQWVTVLKPQAASTVSAAELEIRCIGLIGAGEALSGALVRGRHDKDRMIASFASLIQGALR